MVVFSFEKAFLKKTLSIIIEEEFRVLNRLKVILFEIDVNLEFLVPSIKLNKFYDTQRIRLGRIHDILFQSLFEKFNKLIGRNLGYRKKQDKMVEDNNKKNWVKTSIILLVKIIRRDLCSN